MTERAAIQEALLAQLNADVAADVWDEVPDLVLIVQVNGRLKFAPVPIEDETWTVAEPHRIIRAAADAARQVNERTGWTPFEPGQVLLGIALFNEGWGVTENSREAAEILTAWMSEGNRLVDHPLSIEVKLVSAVLADDLPIMLMHGRGDVKMPGTDAGEVEGRVPDALAHMLNVFMGLTRGADA